MASANSSSSSRGYSLNMSKTRSPSTSNGGAIVRCHHGDVAPVRTIRFPGPTAGKRFYGCIHYPYHCGFFKFVDEIDDVNELQQMVIQRDFTIKGLEAERDELKDAMKVLTRQNYDLNDELNGLEAELDMKTYEAKGRTGGGSGEKKFLLCLLMSWVFFALVFLLH